jgi:hypothetical protein
MERELFHIVFVEAIVSISNQPEMETSVKVHSAMYEHHATNMEKLSLVKHTEDMPLWTISRTALSRRIIVKPFAITSYPDEKMEEYPPFASVTAATWIRPGESPDFRRDDLIRFAFADLEEEMERFSKDLDLARRMARRLSMAKNVQDVNNIRVVFRPRNADEEEES